LSDALREVSLDLQQFSAPKATTQGIEQTWICCDKSGQLFSFTTLEVNDKNIFGLKNGAVYLQLGPREKSAPKRARKEVSDAFTRFENALIKLGAERMP
jgi:hypothetical protein